MNIIKRPTLEQAKKTIELYPKEDKYIIDNLNRYFDSDGNPDDNSIELSDYYNQCKEVLKEVKR